MFWFGAEGDAQEKGEFNENFQLFTIVQTSARPTRVFLDATAKFLSLRQIVVFTFPSIKSLFFALSSSLPV
jgi:hypothetical protein